MRGFKRLTEESSRSWVRGCVATSRTTRFPLFSKTLGREKHTISTANPLPLTSQSRSKLLLVQPDVAALRQLVSFVGRGGLQRPAPPAQHRRHHLHQLRGAPFVSALNHPDLGPSSSLAVPDVLGQQDGLENRKEETGDFALVVLII